ncbi:Fis family transcriptional regulator [Caballeronia sp. 15711]|uniref:Fis family transcriptional regulator n=1 Tax=Caballeronia sp. 15711 TaxID=3391029 RepID=UPI0039E702E0
MASPAWQASLHQSRSKKRLRKTDLLPLPKQIADVLSLEYHLLLESLRAGTGHFHNLQIILRVGLATSLLSSDGYGDLNHDFAMLEAAAHRSFEQGMEKGVFEFDGPTFSMFAHVLTVHDQQIARAPVVAIERLADRMEGMSGR